MIARGVVQSVRGGFLEASLPGASVGAYVRADAVGGNVVAVDGDCAVIALHGDARDVRAGSAVALAPDARTAALGTCLLGRAVDARGTPLDGGAAPVGCRFPVDAVAPQPHEREAISRPLWTGVRAVDALLTIGRGARIGLFGAPGAGKSTLLENIVEGVTADAVVIGLVGERGREAQQWIERRNARTSIVCATSDRSAPERIRAATLALAQAAALRRRGLHVLLLLDSLARVAQALRERAIAAGEAAGRGGYPPSVFAEIARLVEVAGCAHGGSITLIATVLDDGDSRDPVSDSARSLLDGHIQLSSRLAHLGRFPAIDVLASVSRTMNAVSTADHRRDAIAVREAIGLLERTDEARALGIAPEDARTAQALAAEPLLDELLLQGPAPEEPANALERLRFAADTLKGTPWISPQI